MEPCKEVIGGAMSYKLFYNFIHKHILQPIVLIIAVVVPRREND